MDFSDEADEFVGVVEFAGRGGAHGGCGQIAAEGDDALDAGLAVAVKMGGNVSARGAYAGEVRGGLDAGVLDNGEDGLVGAFLAGAASTVGDGEIVGAEGGELLDDGRELGKAFRGAGREELEGEVQ